MELSNNLSKLFRLIRVHLNLQDELHFSLSGIYVFTKSVEKLLKTSVLGKS
jgi:hypothetical protein